MEKESPVSGFRARQGVRCRFDHYHSGYIKASGDLVFLVI